MQEILFTNEVEIAIKDICDREKYDKIFILCDENVYSLVIPQLQLDEIDIAHTIVIPAGDSAKDINRLTYIWQELCNRGASRSSVLINIGGGVVSDLGGFAAATFKRGIAFINIPTTLLGAVDAAIGGKTGINFADLKNEIGAFASAAAVIVSTRFLGTLPQVELLSGYAEMLKHALLESKELFNELLNLDITTCCDHRLLPLMQHSIEYKQSVVMSDPYERTGIRKKLNAGHTFAHAFESHALRQGRPIRHGYAVAWGLVCELIISHRLWGFPSSEVYNLAHFVEQNYGAYDITCDDYDELLSYMAHDKKNSNGKICFTLFRQIGDCIDNQVVDSQEIAIALDFYRDLFHL